MSIFVPVRNDFSHPERESCIRIKRHIGRHILGDKMSEICQRFQLEKELMAAFACFNSQVTVCLGGIRSMSKDWSVRCPTSKFRGLFDTYPHKTDLSNPPPRLEFFWGLCPCVRICVHCVQIWRVGWHALTQDLIVSLPRMEIRDTKKKKNITKLKKEANCRTEVGNGLMGQPLLSKKKIAEPQT